MTAEEFEADTDRKTTRGLWLIGFVALGNFTLMGLMRSPWTDGLGAFHAAGDGVAMALGVLALCVHMWGFWEMLRFGRAMVEAARVETLMALCDLKSLARDLDAKKSG